MATRRSLFIQRIWDFPPKLPYKETSFGRGREEATWPSGSGPEEAAFERLGRNWNRFLGGGGGRVSLSLQLVFA